MARKPALIVTSTALVLALGAAVAWRLTEQDGQGRQRPERGPAAVRVADILHGPIEERRVFTGTLEASARFTVAAQSAGRVQSLAVDLADLVTQGQTMAQLDDGEARQGLLQAQAQRAVADAQHTQALSTHDIAQRTAERLDTLHRQGVASDTQLDAARAEQLEAQAAVTVAQAQLTAALAGVQTAQIRLDQTQARAVWPKDHDTGDGDGPRVVAQRYVNAGDSVSTHDPLFSVVDLDPMTAVIFVTERDYGQIHAGQRVSLDVDAWPGQVFDGQVARVSPVFDAASRQARIEVAVPNPQGALKPGMFARVSVALQRIEDAVSVPADALTRRDDQPTLFVLSADGMSVSQHTVRPGITANGRVQLLDTTLSGSVVTLGQQLLGESALVSVVQEPTTDAIPASAAASTDGAPEARQP